ncbi:MAG TPA: MaoC/PaaZ C-terminal domain-containing protein [Thermodesulfobacteriota bacterium]
MAIDYERLLALRIPDAEHRYTERDTILYALGVGLGHDPVDEAQLAFVYEPGLRVLPTMATILGYPGFWMRDLDTGIDWVRVVHGEQGLVLHRPLPASGTVVGKTRVVDVVDKGPGKGALVYAERKVYEPASGELLATLTQTTVCRGDGGFGGPPRPTRRPHPIPERAPDLACDLPTSPQAALLYRLSGDLNPLHADPAVARRAGFPRPILHGLATYGVAGHALLRTVCGYDTGRLVAMDARFSAPVFPGETIRTEIWRDGARVSFRARVVERDVVVLDNGRAELRR